MRLHLLVPAVLLSILCGCSSDGSDDFSGDPDASERSALLERALLNTQTMVAVSGDDSGADTLTVTTGNNEALAFGRAPGSGGTSTPGGD